MSNRKLFIGLAVFTIVMVAVQVTALSKRKYQTNAIETRFTVRIENISNPTGLKASNGTLWPFALSPGFWIVHEKDFSLFAPGKSAGKEGLEAQAEDGNPSMLLQSFMMHHASTQKGVFNTPLGVMKPGPIGPGGVYEFSFTAKPGMRLSFTAMFGQSNDLFYASDKDGIALFDDKGMAVTGDVTSRIKLWDAGTEVNQEPGVGADQAPRQKAANTGMSEKRPVGRPHDKFSYPETYAVFRVSIMPGQ